MDLEKIKKRNLFSWASVILLAILCAVLAVLQYRWTAQVAAGEQLRLKSNLDSRLELLRRTFNDRIDSACLAFVPSSADFSKQTAEDAYIEKYRVQRASQANIVASIALAIPQGNQLALFVPDSAGSRFIETTWPSDWTAMHNELLARANGGPPGPSLPQIPTLRAIPHFGRAEEGRLGRTISREQNWLILKLNDAYIARTLVPEMLNSYLGVSGKLDYDAQVVVNQVPFTPLYDSEPRPPRSKIWTPDASVALLEIAPPRSSLARASSENAPSVPSLPPFPARSSGVWLLRVHHHAGSLESIVAGARRRNLALSAGLLLLILATVASLVRSSRRERQMAELQMNFVEGVSHELRTPLTVIRTAAFNLRGNLAQKPDQVTRYGALIQTESEKLTALVDQVLRYGSARSGRLIAQRSPIAIDALIESTLQSSRLGLENSNLTIEKEIAPNLPLVLADPEAMEHVLQNLFENAVKYGTESSNWIGIFAASAPPNGAPAVEIRVADHGPGIPKEEREHIFDSFYRGRRAVQDQIHGTGLGLTLAKKIVEAHGGTITVKSQPSEGTEFIVRLPAATAGAAE
ncbi:MAG: HAMP domain-containing sensor histidine kinase [Candidatus Acidiferrales bacterium]